MKYALRRVIKDLFYFTQPGGIFMYTPLDSRQTDEYLSRIGYEASRTATCDVLAELMEAMLRYFGISECETKIFFE